MQGAGVQRRPGEPAWGPAQAATGRPSDLSGKAVQNLLLGLGGVLLVVAAIVFTVVSWGYFGIGGRAAILLGFTVLTLAAPAPLRRRGLTATAETVAMLGLVLMFLDGYAARQVNLAGLGEIHPQQYISGLITLIAAVFAAYGRVARLRLPIPVSVVLAQLPLIVLAIDEGALWCIAALIVTAIFDAAIWVPARSIAPAVSAACFGVTWTIGTAAGLLESFEPHTFRDALNVSGALVVAVIVGLFVAVRASRPWSAALAALSSVALIVALALPVRLLLPTSWAIVPAPVVALLVAAIAALLSRTAFTREGDAQRQGEGGSAAVWRTGRQARVEKPVAITAVMTMVLASTPVLLPVLVALAGPFGDGRVWAGARTGDARDELGSAWFVAGPPDLVVLMVMTLAFAAAALFLTRSGGVEAAVSPAPGTPAAMDQAASPEAVGGGRRTGLKDGLLVLAGATGGTAVAVMPVALDLSYALAIAVQLGLAVLLGVIAGRTVAPGRAVAFGALALAAALEVGVWALVSQPATLIAVGILAVTAAPRAFGGQAGAVQAGAGEPAPAFRTPAGAVRAGVAGVLRGFGGRVGAVRAGAAATGVLLGGGEAVALWIAADADPRYSTFVLLGVAGLAGLASALVARERAVRLAAEIAGYALGLLGLLLAADLAMFSVACAVAAVLAFGTALRPDRRAAGYVGTGLLLLASWTRLYVQGIDVVEAYTVPFSLVILGVGWWRARKASSWVAYGTGLTSSLLPSLLAVYAESEGWLRPLALGVVSLAVLLAGARWRLQAPAVLGGFTLLAVAVHELAPWIVELVTAVPRWVPMAVGGLLLLLVGATYEARLKDARRMRDMVRALR